MRQRVPPLNPLHTFCCAARHCSFTLAAEDLGVTQSAVSRQVAVLEQYLGVLLFLRDRQGLRLTREGKRYFQKVEPAFRQIVDATARIETASEQEPLRLQVYPTFMAKWLSPRLHRFEAEFPDSPIRVTSSVAPIDFARSPVDAAIQLGDGQWPAAETTFLFGDTFVPVCSPRLLADRALIREALDLLGFPLLHSHYRRMDWAHWFMSLGIDPPAETSPRVFASSLLTYQAAIDGLGIAMGQPRMLEKEIARGELVVAFPHSVSRDLGYYLLTPRTIARRRRLRRFRKWLLSQIDDAWQLPATDPAENGAGEN